MSWTDSYLRLSGSNPLGLKLCQGGLGAWGKNPLSWDFPSGPGVKTAIVM